MEINQDVLAGTAVYKLNPADIDHLFRRSGLKGNSLSSCSYNAEQAATSSPSELFKKLSESPQFRPIAQHLLEPDLKIQFNSGGAGTAKDQYYALLSADDKSVLVQMTNSDGDILLMLFPDWDSYLAWWIDVYASPGMDGYQTIFPNIMETEVLVCALHCVDIYRRAYMESMLDYRGGVDLSLSIQDFVQLLKRALASGDQRWLLPTMFEITPGLKNASIALNPDHLKQIEELGFIITDADTINLGERARIMGTEFITSWIGAFGWQAAALINGQERSLSRVFLAPTAFTNHLVSFETAEAGKSRFRHQAADRQALLRILSDWMKALSQAVGLTAGVASSEPLAASEPPARFCSNCGAEIRPGKRFCTACGSAL
jgi:hypothetical protein